MNDWVMTPRFELCRGRMGKWKQKSKPSVNDIFFSPVTG